MATREVVNKLFRRVKNVRTTNNTQRALLKLLKANGEWVSNRELMRHIASATSRVRDLRKQEFGRFNVQCVRAEEVIGKPASKYVFFYRVVPRSVSATKVSRVLRTEL